MRWTHHWKNTLQIVMVEHLASALLNYPHKKCERLKRLRFLLLPSTYQLFLVHFETESTNITTPASCSRHWEHSFPNDLILYLFSLCLVIELQCLSKKKSIVLSWNSCLLVLTVCTDARLEIEKRNTEIPAPTKCGWMVQALCSSSPTLNIDTVLLMLGNLLNYFIIMRCK